MDVTSYMMDRGQEKITFQQKSPYLTPGTCSVLTPIFLDKENSSNVKKHSPHNWKKPLHHTFWRLPVLFQKSEVEGFFLLSTQYSSKTEYE